MLQAVRRARALLTFAARGSSAAASSARRRCAACGSVPTLVPKLVAVTSLCAGGGTLALANERPKTREEVIEEYVEGLHCDGQFWKITGLSSPPSLLGRALFRPLALEILAAAEGMMGHGQEDLFLGHRIKKLFRYGELKHTGVGMSFEMCELIADVLLADERVNMKWVPDALERPMLIALCRLVSCLWFDMVLSMRVDVGKSVLKQRGLWKLEWRAADRDMSRAESRQTQFFGRDRVEHRVNEALERIDVATLDMEAARMCHASEGVTGTLVHHSERSFFRTALLVVLTFVHLTGTASEVSLGGVQLQVCLAPSDPSTSQR